MQVSFTDDAGHAESLTSAATAIVVARPNRPATGAPTISGTAQVEQTLTASTSGIADADGLNHATFNYQWIAGGSDIAGATGSSYTLTSDEEGQTLKVQVSFTDDAGHAESLTSAATATVAAWPNSAATGAPTISGTAQVAQTLTASTSGIADADGLTNVSYSYQWIAGGADIAGATGSSYTLTSDEEGQTLKVQVSFTDDAGHAESLTSAATATVAARPNRAATGAPTISGTAQVAQTLTASTSGIADADGLTNVSYSYQWVRNDGTSDTDIADATASTYTLVAADEGKTIKVKASFTDDASHAESMTSVATTTVAARPNSAATGVPTIGGTTQVGETLTVSTSGIADTDGLSTATFSYQWLRNDGTSDTDIADAAASTYTLVAADEGKTIKVKASFTDDASHAESVTSVATTTVAARPNSAATGVPTISGTAQVGETLSASTSGIADADGLTNVSYSYQWIAGGSDIAGATGSSYTLTSDEEGQTLKVQVSFTDDADNEESLTSAATDAVVAAEPSEPPDKPTGLSAKATTHGQVTLTWEDPGDDSITGYVILRRIRVNNQGGDFDERVANTGSAATTYTDNEVVASTTYTYRIKAINEHGVSERSRWSHIDTLAPPVPDKPLGLEATATHDSITLTWEDPGDDSITGYVILRRIPGVDPEGQFDELVSDTGTAATTYTDGPVSAETRYTYRIKAINEHGVSERSRWCHIDTSAAP